MFFFFDYSTEFINPLGLGDSDRELVRERLNKETTARGLRNVELAELTGWSTSKVSKVTSGKQKLTDDDIRVWTRTLGYTPSAFLEPDYDLRSFNITDHVRSVTECLSAYYDSDEGTLEHDAIINYELPLSIFGSLELNPVDYAVRTKASKKEKAPVTITGKWQHGYVRIWHRGTVVKDEMTPELYIGFGPRLNGLAVILYLNRYATDGALSMLRQTYKDALKIDDEDQAEYYSFIRENSVWLPRNVREGEISFYLIPSAEALPDETVMMQTLTEIFTVYFDLVWQVKGVDLKPKHFKNQEQAEFNAIDQYNALMGNNKLPPVVEDKVIKSNQCQCEIDPGHKTFTTESGSQFMEAVPLIPTNLYNKYGTAITGEANGMCLCPTCHAKLLWGKHDDREQMVMNLYLKHRGALKEAGIKITLSELLYLYGL